MKIFQKNTGIILEERISNAQSERLDLRNTGLSDEVVPNLVNLLNRQPKITQLSLSRTNISDKATESLSQLNHVTYLNVGQTDISDEGAMRLIGANRFDHIILENTELTDSITACILKNATQIYLNLNNSGLSRKSIDRISEKIKENRSQAEAKIEPSRAHQNGYL